MRILEKESSGVLIVLEDGQTGARKCIESFNRIGLSTDHSIRKSAIHG